ncbi:NYN domain-containing protein [Microbacterium oryzae]|uniref:NYN domain-containing protein n=1 Tax=Microbacterium oryzae TaxID=743009 RepID=UPI003F53F060
MSWYDRVHGRNSYSRDRSRIAESPHDPEIADRLARATVDVGAIIDYAASYGTLVLTRAYADWSAPVNAIYRQQLVARAVDLVQLFPAAAYAKNGADIRLAVDAVEDMFRLPDLTHVVIVAGDSDYVPLAQRCRRLGRYFVGVGVAGSTAKSLAAACDEFEPYDSLPGVQLPARPAQKAKSDEKAAPEKADGQKDTAKPADAGGTAATKDEGKDVPEDAAATKDETEPKAKPRTRRGSKPKLIEEPKAPEVQKAPEEPETFLAFDETPPEDLHAAASRLLERALRVGQGKGDDAGWLHSSAVKQHIRRMDPSFSEKALGYRSFSDFLKSRDHLAELEETGHERLVRLKA